MGYPNRDNRGGRSGGRGFGGRSFGGEKRFRPAEMHKAICSNCGKECEVPFKPSDDKPVYCRDCFAKNRSHEERNFGGDRRESRPAFKRFDDNRQNSSPRTNELDSINNKLDQILKILNNRSESTITKETPVEVIEKKKKVSKKTLLETPQETPEE